MDRVFYTDQRSIFFRQFFNYINEEKRKKKLSYIKYYKNFLKLRINNNSSIFTCGEFTTNRAISIDECGVFYIGLGNYPFTHDNINHDISTLTKWEKPQQ